MKKATKRRSDGATKGRSLHQCLSVRTPGATPGPKGQACLSLRRSLPLAIIALSAIDATLDTAGTNHLAYIGPGAGIALLGSFMAIFSAVLSALLFVLTWPFRLVWRTMRGRRALRSAKAKRVVILGLDGLEPTLAERLMDEGRLPNLAALRAGGTYTRLGTTWPPLSPVAWSSFLSWC